MDNIKLSDTFKYEYHLLTWGGFYNEQYQIIHKEKPGDYWFDSPEERQEYIDKLKSIEKELNAHSLAMSLTEGFHSRVMTKLHRVIEFEGEQFISENEMGFNYPFESAKYHLEYKWRPGFNDYPLGEDFDYENKPVKIIQEWISGAFSVEL